MTNNYAFQGQKYTNGVGAMPQRMMGSSSDLCSILMGLCHPSPAGALENIWFLRKQLCQCVAGGISQASAASEVQRRKQPDNTEPLKDRRL